MYHRLFKEADLMRLPRRTVVILLSLYLLGTLMELSSLAILMPVFQFIQSGGDVAALTAEHRHWRILTDVYALVDLTATLASLLATSFVFLILRQVFTYIRLIVQAGAKENMIARMRADAFESFLHADTTYQDHAEAGGLINDLTTDLQRAADYMFGQIMFAGILVVITIYTIGLFVLSIPMTLTAIGIFGIALLLLQTQMRKSEIAGREVVQANQRMSTFLVERLRLARLVRLAGMESAESDHMRALTTQQRNGLMRLFTLLSRVDVIMEPIVIGAAYILIFVSIESFGLNIEQIGLFLVIILRLLPMVKEIARTRQSNRATKAAHTTITARLAEMSSAREEFDGTRPFEALTEGCRFDGVHFTYRGDSDKPAMNDVSVTFEAGQLTALVGPSGAGKSTLIDLIPRLRRPDQGQILLDGVGIDQFSLESLRAGIAYAPQSPQIFNVTITEHIRYGKADATMDEVRRAAELANAVDFIEELPDGFDTRVGESGTRLSGGQRQRLDLARALVRQSPILLLDEPTSNLDADSEALFRDALTQIRRETSITTIVIAHRLSTVTMADKIVVLEAGRVTSDGSHDDLVEAGSWYASAFRKQGGLSAAAQ
jgi:subfamily B ATP-binding cassette protein MsbA